MLSYRIVRGIYDLQCVLLKFMYFLILLNIPFNIFWNNFLFINSAFCIICRFGNFGNLKIDWENFDLVIISILYSVVNV